MQALEQLEQNVAELIRRYQQLQEENQRLREANETQRQEMIRTHSDLTELQQKYSHLYQAHSLSVTPENRERAYQQITALIQRVDRAIEILKQ